MTDLNSIAADRSEEPSSSRRLRILHLLPTFGLAGAEHMAAQLLLALSQSHDMGAVSLAAASSKSPIDAWLSEGGIAVWHLGKRPGFDPRMFLAVRHVLREFRPQIVHTHLSAVLRYVLPSMLRPLAPLWIHTVHTLAEHESDATGRIAHRVAFRRSLIPVAVSQAVADSVRRVYGAGNVVTIPNGIPVSGYSPDLQVRARWRSQEGFDARAVLFTYVGRLQKPKDPLLLVKAFASVSDERSHLVLAGDGNLERQVAERVRAHGLGSRVHLLGRRADIADCLAAADVFVLPSDWEGNPLSVMEAMASGLPVICSAVGGIPELVQTGQEGVLVPPGDAESLAAAMRLMLENPQARREMGAAAHVRAVSQFTLERMVRQYDGLYRSALRSRSPAADESVRTDPCGRLASRATTGSAEHS